MRTVPSCAAICSLSLTALAAADVYIFDNSLTYAAFCNDLGVVRQAQDLSTISAGSYNSITGGSGDYAWNLSAPSGVFLDGAGTARTQQNAEKLSLTFSSSNVFAVGGFFYNVDNGGSPRAGVMRIRLNDGTTFIRTVSNSTTFSGFVSDGASIASVEVSHAGNLGSQYFVATSGFSVGVVPAPGAAALIGLAGMIARRRRA
jgi:hypothetical protein